MLQNGECSKDESNPVRLPNKNLCIVNLLNGIIILFLSIKNVLFNDFMILYFL